MNLPGEQGISPLIPEGLRACTIPVNEVTGVGGHIRNGDTVDIIGTFRTLGEKRIVKDLEAVTLFQNVAVLATGKNYRFDPRVTPTKSKSILAIGDQSSGLFNGNRSGCSQNLHGPSNSSTNGNAFTHATILS